MAVTADFFNGSKLSLLNSVIKSEPSAELSAIALQIRFFNTNHTVETSDESVPPHKVHDNDHYDSSDVPPK